MSKTLEELANRCVGRVLGQLDIIDASEETKKAIKSHIWDFKNDVRDKVLEVLQSAK